MAQSLSLSPIPPLRVGPIPASPSSSRLPRSNSSTSASPPPSTSSRLSQSPRAVHRSLASRYSESKENEPLARKASSSMSIGDELNGVLSPSSKDSRKLSKSPERYSSDGGNGGGRLWRDGSLEISDDGLDSGIRSRKPDSSRSTRSKTSNGTSFPVLPTIPADSDIITNSLPGKGPPPAPSTGAQLGNGVRPAIRPRRSSSIKRKPSPGVTPTKVVDWEIPRKTLHSSIGFLTLLLNYLDPPTLRPLLTVLITGLVTVGTVDLIRLRSPVFANFWEQWFGFLMRESERGQINGVVWYLVGVIFVLALYPRDVAVVAILTLSWSDTTASTIGRLWGRYTKPLPAHVPFIKALPFAPRKSLAGFLAATVTGSLIGLSFWWNGSNGRWDILDGQSKFGLISTAAAVGVGGAVVEALDLGLDDNLTLPILSGALVWLWLGITNLIF